MRTSSPTLTVAFAGVSAALLTGVATAPALAQDSADASVWQAQLTDAGYDEVSCGVPSFSGNAAVVPALPAEGTQWVLGGVTADVGEEDTYSDLVGEPSEGDRLSVVDADGAEQHLVSAVVCSALTESGDITPDAFEGNFGGRPYAIAVNGVALERPGPVVETDATAGTSPAEAPPDIPEPEGLVNGGVRFDSTDFWQDYLTGLGLTGVTCSTDDPSGERAYTLDASTPQDSGWAAAVLVSASGADDGVDYGDSLIKLIPYPTIGQEYQMLYEEDYYLQLSNVILCQADLDTTDAPPA